MRHFFAYLSRMRLIRRWGLMRNTYEENIQEHSLQVALVAHGLAVIRNTYFGGKVNADRVMTLAAFHEAGEVFTGDLATPIKYFNPEIKKAYDVIEDFAKERLGAMLPEELQPAYRPLLFPQAEEQELWKIVKAADKICAYLKCVEELKSGNQEFVKAERAIRTEIEKIDAPEMKYFMEHFVPSFALALDELN
jgi:5'-deoxynucleotidase